MTKKNKFKKNVMAGDTVIFKRGDMWIAGTVHSLRENTAIVEISQDDMKALGYTTNLTVINHKNYVVLFNEFMTV